jgi:hypothetical protein
MRLTKMLTHTKSKLASFRIAAATATATSMGVCTFVCAFVCTFVCTLLTMPQAHAQNTSAPPANAPIFVVTPFNAPALTPRNIVVSGQWPDSCAPVAATFDTLLATDFSTIVLRLVQSQSLAPCAQVRTPYRFELAYTPLQTGILRVLITNTAGRPATESRIVTTPADVTRSAGNISGVWFDPATNGSGVTFVHGYTQSDSVFGTWYLYDANGNPRWLSMQNSVWREGGTVLEADLLQTQALAPECAPLRACPATSGPARTIGRVKVTFVGIGVGSDVGAQGKIEAVGVDGVPLFSSSLIRLF